MFQSPESQFKILTQGAVDMVAPEELKTRLSASFEKKKPLRVKYGADPSSPDLHLGHTVPLRKLRQFQDCGHLVVFIIGDFTARIGDPSHRSETRPMLSEEQIKQNALTYQEQVFKILDKSKTEVRYNSEWLAKMSPADFLHLTSQYTVARLLERDDFSKRYKSNQPIALIEFLYPLLQGYDSVVIDSDLELGGTDQKFNLLVGRELQKIWGKKPQMIMTLPIIEGTDGVKKMSKSLGNAIAINDEARDIFGKLMSIPDKLAPSFAQYASGMSEQELSAFLEKFKQDPRNGKADLAEKIAGFFQGTENAKLARSEFDRMFKEKGLPDEIETVKLPQKSYGITALLVDAGLAPSKSEAKRLIEQGGVRINQEKISDLALNVDITAEVLVQCGKRKFAKVKHGG